MAKIKYGISNLHYAIATIGTNGSATYASPVALPGARAISLSPDGDMVNFYADNGKYWVGETNNGYTGSVTVAMIPDDFKKAILGFVLDNKGMIFEDPDVESVHFALIGQFETDSKARRFVFYNCVASRPDTAGNTKEAAISPEEETINLEIGKIYNASLSRWMTQCFTTESTADADYASFLTAVYQPSALPATT